MDPVEIDLDPDPVEIDLDPDPVEIDRIRYSKKTGSDSQYLIIKTYYSIYNFS